MAMQFQVQAAIIGKAFPAKASLLAPTANVGLRRPSDRFALKSSFFSSSLRLLMLVSTQNQYQPLVSTAPRFSMRVASKEAYICRDCGYPFL